MDTTELHEVDLKYEEKSNGIREYFPNGIKESEPKPAR
jgi:hypothetical protein